jgi:hypothetical protein
MKVTQPHYRYSELNFWLRQQIFSSSQLRAEMGPTDPRIRHIPVAISSGIERQEPQTNHFLLTLYEVNIRVNAYMQTLHVWRLEKEGSALLYEPRN